MNRLPKVWLVALLAASLAAGGTVWARLDPVKPGKDLAECVPQGALLSLQTQDFSQLVKDWTSSPEKEAWLKSDDYAVFSRSRLFGRLQDAQAEFADAAGLPVDSDLLKDMAGNQSFFAWYDIGELQVVYITRMTSAQVSRSRLWQRRKKFETRQAGGVTFYVHTSKDQSSDTGGSDAAQTAEDDSNESESAESTVASKKTVAFAESGDWLIIATSEDLMAQTLELMAKKDHAGEDSLAQQNWYKEANAAAKGPEGTLRMALNMEKIVKTPQFRTYWVQQNVTEMKQYRAVLVDLYRDQDGLREERVLVPESETTLAADVDLGQMAALAPDHTAVFRVTSRPTAATAFATLQTKVLDRGVGSFEDTTAAPSADLDTPQAGSVTDLETRIDESAAVTAEKPGSLPQLANLLQGASLEAMMTVDRNSTDGKAEGIWTPFASAVVLSSAQNWDMQALLDAVQQTVQADLTVGSLGTAWQKKTSHGETYFATNEAHGLQLYVNGHICVVADDEAFLAEIIQQQAAARGAREQPAIMVAGFDHDAARPGFAQWTTIVDVPPSKSTAMDSTPPAAGEPEQDADTTPVSFWSDIRSLSDTFAAMKQERFIAWHDGALVRQTVRYTWRR